MNNKPRPAVEINRKSLAHLLRFVRRRVREEQETNSKHKIIYINLVPMYVHWIDGWHVAGLIHRDAPSWMRKDGRPESKEVKTDALPLANAVV